jgi:hypothetical protein
MSLPAYVVIGGDPRLALLHRRLCVGMALAGIVAFSAGVGWTVGPALAAGVILLLTLRWRLSPAASARLEPLWLPVALLLMTRALFLVFGGNGDIVIPVVDLLLLLMTAEALRSTDTFNDVRLYGLSFALLLAATAYRPGVAFAAAFVTYVALASPALMLGNLRRKLRRYGVSEAYQGRALWMPAAALSGVTLLASVLVFLIFPRSSQGWAGRGEPPATSMAGFADEVALGAWGSRIMPNPAVVMRVEFPNLRPGDYASLHWRGRSYDHFDGFRWTRSARIRPSSGSTGLYRQRWSGPVVQQRIYGELLEMRVLFALHPLIDADPESPIHPLMDDVGDFAYWGTTAPVYTAYSLLSRPSENELRASGGTYRPDTQAYTQLPRLPARIATLADSLTRDEPTRYDKAERIERWLRSEFAYTLELPTTPAQATLDHFLFVRRAGHCEYFASAMVVMLRTLGIESRIVNGFLGGSWSEFGNYLAVTQNDAHSWVEVWFPGHGWVPFDPTPAGGSTDRVASSWLWPGRVLVDGLQHRWGKWVLDYSLQNQADALGRAAAALRGRRAQRAEQGGSAGPLITWALIGVLAVLSALFWKGRRGATGSVETRLYLKLLESARRAGLVAGQVAPLELVDRIRRYEREAGGPASLLVRLYMRARFAGEGLIEADQAEMARALRTARRALAERRRRAISGEKTG